MSLLDLNNEKGSTLRVMEQSSSSSRNDLSQIPEQEYWITKPRKTENPIENTPINSWLREVFDSPDSPLFIHRDNLVALIDSLATKGQKSALHYSESSPSLALNRLSRNLNTSSQDLDSYQANRKISNQVFTASLSSKNLSQNNSTTNLYNSTNLPDIQSMARMEEDNLKAQVAALGKRHTGSQGSLYNSVAGFSSILSNYDEHSPHNSLTNLHQSFPNAAFATMRIRNPDVLEQKNPLPPPLKAPQKFSLLEPGTSQIAHPKLSGLPTLSRQYHRSFAPSNLEPPRSHFPNY
ncbi:hypothetical protein Ciccas_013741 [Cichlidogyrus casuarinus]|uniref:Uncharacterized protein n=1 Tax=Cichlidogyrus casuarinus TaxID=1844966 RepID=A0ABD2PJW5_9PLAT